MWLTNLLKEDQNSGDDEENSNRNSSTTEELCKLRQAFGDLKQILNKMSQST